MLSARSAPIALRCPRPGCSGRILASQEQDGTVLRCSLCARSLSELQAPAPAGTAQQKADQRSSLDAVATWRQLAATLSAAFTAATDQPVIRHSILPAYQLGPLLALVALAGLAGARGPAAVARWAEQQPAELRQALGLPDDVAQYALILRILLRRAPDPEYYRTFAQWRADQAGLLRTLGIAEQPLRWEGRDAQSLFRKSRM